MLSWWRNIVFALLLAGVISADDGARLASENASADSSIKDMRVEIGEDLPISIPSEKVTRCYVTRNKDTVELAPKDESNGKIVRREPNALFGCQASINNIQKEDAGIWKLGYETENSKDHIRVNVVINEKESDSLPNNNGNEDEALDTILRSVKLPRINHNAHLGSEITITLSKQLYDETCYLKPPRGDEKSLEEEIPGVTAFPTSTYFVSCRVVIGPMKYNLLGTWTLCGRHSDGLVTYERCQPANIQWIHDNPEATWDVTTNPVSDQPIHFGITLTPNVKGRNEVETCHIVTPNGEDLTVGTRSDYPGLTLVIVKDTCRIDILPVNDNFVGNWTLYGTFQSAFWYNSLAQPLNVFIYDEEDPYNQAYNVTNANSEDVLVNMGNIMTINVAGRGDLDKCEIVTNTGERYDEDTAASLPYVKISSTNDDSKPMCVIQVGPITKDLLGNWRLIGKFNRKDIHSEIRLPFNIIEDDPRNPFVDESRMVQNLSPRQLVTSFGSTHDVSTPSDKNGITQSCHIRTPDNLQYVLMPGQSVAGVEIIQGSSMSCGVRMHVESEAVIGDWVLISREYTRGEHIEKRLAFTISIEDVVPAASKEIVIAEGSDMYQWRRDPTDLYQTCSLHGPVRNDAEVDANFVTSCGYIVRGVTLADSGVWQIVYGNSVTYTANIRVTVNPRFALHDKDFLWTRDASVNETVGPEDTVYCRIEDPSGRTISEGFGRCSLVVDRVTKDHVGVWKMMVATTGQVLTETHEFVVKVSEAVPKAEVTTSVEVDKPYVSLSCRVPSDVQLTACKFRDPAGRVLLVREGVGEDRYSFHIEGASLESGISAHSCGLRVANPQLEDLGLWRCAIETKEDTHYGFLTVVSPWAMKNPEVAAAVVTEPTLIAVSGEVAAVEGDSVSMRCSVQAAIRYCYFRARNGTIYNVSPGSSERYEYIGAGLDAGECGIRFNGLQPRDSGNWSCHVGFLDHHQPEQRATINLAVDPLMVAQQYHLEGSANTLVVSASVHGQRSLEYCRFVRIDGLGFTSEEVPSGYKDYSMPRGGRCEIRVPNPSILEMHPWTVVVRIRGQDVELARSTEHTLETDQDKPGHHDKPDHGPPKPDHERPGRPDRPPYHNSGFIIVWISALVISVVLFIVGMMMGTKRSRQWAVSRSSAVRDSFRRTFYKAPPPYQQNIEKTATIA